VIEAYRSGDLLNCVNVVHTRLGTSTITIRHYDRVGVLAAVFEELRKSEINVQTMQNKVLRVRWQPWPSLTSQVRCPKNSPTGFPVSNT